MSKRGLVHRTVNGVRVSIDVDSRVCVVGAQGAVLCVLGTVRKVNVEEGSPKQRWEVVAEMDDAVPRGGQGAHYATQAAGIGALLDLTVYGSGQEVDDGHLPEPATEPVTGEPPNYADTMRALGVAASGTTGSVRAFTQAFRGSTKAERRVRSGAVVAGHRGWEGGHPVGMRKFIMPNERTRKQVADLVATFVVTGEVK